MASNPKDDRSVSRWIIVGMLMGSILTLFLEVVIRAL